MSTRTKFVDLVRDAVARSGTGDVWIERDMEVEEPIHIFDQGGFRICGTTARRPVLYWTGTADNMLDFANCRDTVLENFCIEVHGSLGSNVLHYWRKVKGRTTPTNNQHQDLACLVRPGGYLSCFASHDLETETGEMLGIDENNEFSRYDNIDLNGEVGDGIRFVGQQSHGHVLSRCRLNVRNDAVVSSGWFSATDVSGSGVACAFHLAGISAPIHIVRPNFEATKRLLIAEGTEGFSGDAQPIVIEGGSTRCDQLHVDGAVIDLKHRGPLRVIGHQFGSGMQPVPHIRTWTAGTVSVEASVIGSFGSYGQPFIRRPDGSADTESYCIRTYAHTIAGEPVRCPGW